jgi:hypothetical protein
MTARSIPELIRDLTAEARAKRQYSTRCGFLFELEDYARSEGLPELTRLYHQAAVAAGHAAWAEEVDPEVR